jgi:hypothetical protein
LAGEKGIRLSLAGAQHKIAVRIEVDEIPLPPGRRAEYAHPKTGMEHFAVVNFKETKRLWQARKSLDNS